MATFALQYSNTSPELCVGNYNLHSSVDCCDVFLSLFSDEGFRGLSLRPQHYIQRSKCLNKFKELYGGHLPLHYTHARITYEPPFT